MQGAVGGGGGGNGVQLLLVITSILNLSMPFLISEVSLPKVVFPDSSNMYAMMVREALFPGRLELKLKFFTCSP